MPANTVPSGGSSSAQDRLERRDDLAEMAVIAVVLVADDDEVGGLGDRLVSPRVGRSIGVEDDPQALGLDQERRVAVPGDPHDGVSGVGSSIGRANRPDDALDA